MKRRIYIYQTDIPPEMAIVFEQLSDNIHVEQTLPNLLVLIDEDYYNEEPIDLEEFYLLLVEDFEQDVTFFIEPYLENDFECAAHIIDFLPELPPNVYYLDDLMTYAVLRQNETLKQAFKEYILTRTNADVIHTVREFIENNMNSSVSAKKLYMHRNTLNYRIDNFIEATTINVKTFKGANAIYLLYKY